LLFTLLMRLSDVKRGQPLEAETEANFLKLWIRSIKWWLTAYRWIYIIMIKMIVLFLILMYYCVMSCSRQTPNRLVSIFLTTGSSAADRGQADARPMPNVWGRGRGQSFEAEAKILPSRLLGLEDLTSLDITALYGLVASPRIWQKNPPASALCTGCVVIQ